MATKKKRSAQRAADRGLVGKKARGGVAMKRGRRRRRMSAGKVSTGASSAAIAAALNRLESRVDTLEHNDAATYGLLLGMVNTSRKHHGKATIKSLPGFVAPRLYGQAGTSAKRALGKGR